MKTSQRHLIHKIFLFYPAVCLLILAGFAIWVIKTNQRKKYEEMYNKWQKQKIANQAIPEITGTEYYETLPEYTGKSSFVPKGMYLEKVFVYFFIGLIALAEGAFIYLLIVDFQLSGFIYMLVFPALFTFICLISYWLSSERQVQIDETGFTLLLEKEVVRFFPWDKIKTIGLSVGLEGKRISWGYLYFTTKELKRDRVIVDYFEKPHTIMLKYRPKVVHCILKYWDKEIRNLESMKNWLRYINKL